RELPPSHVDIIPFFLLMHRAAPRPTLFPYTTLFRSSFKVPDTFFIDLIWALPPTRDTEIPTLIAGRTPELNKSPSKKICPSVMEITLVGIYADTSPA